ncbi:myc target protein 1 homolog [Carassius auratus]|uniref:Myc target protein 1 homolog n=1 Tax=Carassius auratus TaxID=7957 RepID=A0A6P6RB16_CARAU|nr:myc target protein 1 homolog [Carassius auratus]XP_052435970.1 myc target protein 1 homolog [Carassius gibelio]
MASNETNVIWEMLKPIDFEELILAFCLSILIGLLIGILIFLLLTWMSRRRASVRITRRQTQSSESKGTRNQHCHLRHYKSHGFDKNSESAGRVVLPLHRQTSVDPNELLGRSPSFQNSTFRPPPKKTKKTGNETEDDNQAALLPNITDPFSAEPAESFWLGKGSLRGFLPRQTPPPAYDSVIHIFQESCT